MTTGRVGRGNSTCGPIISVLNVVALSDDATTPRDDVAPPDASSGARPEDPAPMLAPPTLSPVPELEITGSVELENSSRCSSASFGDDPLAAPPSRPRRQQARMRS